MNLERITFTEIAMRLSRATGCERYVGHVNILVSGWNNRRARHGLSPINFAQRVKDTVEWQLQHGLPVNKERYMYADELEMFSKYVGYDLTKHIDNQ